MKRLLLFLGLITAAGFSFAQKKDANAVKFAGNITPADLKKLLYTIAGPEMEGRGTATPGIVKAAGFIADQFKSYGLAPANNGSYFYNYPLYKDSVTENVFEVNGVALTANTDFATNGSFSYQTGFSQVTFIGALQDTAGFDKMNLRGRCVLISDSYLKPGSTEMTTLDRTALFQKMNLVQNKGAAVILIASSRAVQAQQMGRGGLRVNKYGGSINLPVYNISRETANKILGDSLQSYLTRMADGNLKSKMVKTDVGFKYSRIQTEVNSLNVAAVLEGTDKKDEWVLITAHMDHLGKRDNVIYYGADDDGSGTCAVMELAEAFAAAKKAGKGPRRSILFMTVSGEEMGLLGSEAYTKKPLFPLSKATVDLNIDMIGRVGSEYKNVADSANYVYVIGDDKLSSDLNPITDAANTYTKLKLDRKYNDVNDPNRFYFRSDHFNFADKGVPIIFYFNGVHEDYHKATDTPDKINYNVYAKRAQLVFYTAWEMANRNDMLKRDIPLPELTR